MKKQEDTLVSVIIPVYKVEPYLDQCLQSVTGQTYRSLEIILVDDGSPDGCPEICDKWALRDTRIKVIHKKNGGLSDARNAGLDAAGGQYICFIDSDEWVMKDMIEKLLTSAVKEGADICACGIMDCYPDHQTIRTAKYLKGGSEEIYRRLYNETEYPVSAWGKIYRRSCWDRLRFPVGRICEDAFTTYLLIDRAACLVQIPEVLYCYRIRENSIMRSPFTAQRMDEEKAWRYNAQFIRDKYPSVSAMAFDFYLKKVNRLAHTITAESRILYRKQYRYLRSVLRRNTGYILFGSRMPVKQRLWLIKQIAEL